MPAIRKDLTADAGAVFKVSVQYNDSNEQPVNLNGYGATLTVTTGKGTSIASLVGTVNSDGWINVKATDEATAAWPVGKQSYRLDLQDPSGDIERLFFGTVNVRAGVTV